MIKKTERMNKLIITILFCVLGLTTSVAQTDIHFSQIDNAPLFINPANAGFYRGHARLIMNYRQQWMAIQQPFSTYGASFDFSVLEKNKKIPVSFGIGLYGYKDQGGLSKFSTLDLGLAFNTILRLETRHKLSAAVMGNFLSRSLVTSPLLFEDQFDINNGGSATLPTRENFAPSLVSNKPDLGVGLKYQYSLLKSDFDRDDRTTISGGVSVRHLLRPSMVIISDTSRVGLKFTAHAESDIEIDNSRFSFHPMVMYALQNTFKEFYGGGMVKYRFNNVAKISGFIRESSFSVGAFYRSFNDAISPRISIDFKGINISAAYDINISKFNTATRSNGGMEFALKWVNLKDALYKAKDKPMNED
jgi:type IX secretion system PorP/SprF family membrane protein